MKLFVKLAHYGVRDSLLNWIRSFLSSRTQSTCEGHFSSTAPVTSGVPHGTVLGQLLFLVYINDLPSKVSSKDRLFADDCLLYRTFTTLADACQLQSDLENLQQWESDWQMHFNPDKFEVIRITTKWKQRTTPY